MMKKLLKTSLRLKKKPKRGRKKKVEVSNDDEKSEAAAEPKAEEPKDYETVNEAPKTKKKGWWSK